MADWDEIKRLAADFQKVQLSSSAQRLSERNCIEIITWLTQRKMIDLIFTSDGKDYMTASHLINDIRGELYVNGGRVNLVELAKIIGVDLSHVNAHLNEVLKGHKDIHSILGQLVDSTYIAKIAGEINEKLQQQGQINISDLTLQYDLPADFLQQQVLEKNLGKLIFGKQDKKDPRIFFTESFIARTKSKIRGALTGLTKPTPITIILNHADVSERLFFSLFDQCCSFGTLTNRLMGAQYIPNVYTRSQNEWVNNFYKQNGYLEFDALIRLGISDYKTYIKKHLNDDTICLDSCFISKTILDRAEADIDECIISKSYVDLQNNLPSVLNENDINKITETILSTRKSRECVVIENYILSKPFLDNLISSCNEKVEKNANKAVEDGKYQHYQTEIQIVNTKIQKTEELEESKSDKREERRKKASGGKSGGGTQGRETKTKSTKKHYRPGKSPLDVKEEIVLDKKISLEIISLKEIIDAIQTNLEEESLDTIADQISAYMYPLLNEKGLEIASNLYASTVSDRTAYRRHTHNELQNKINALIGDIRLFEKGTKFFQGNVQINLNKYLLKTLCTDILQELLNYIAAEENINILTDNFSSEQRVKFINELTAAYKNPLLNLLKVLSGESVEDFLNSIDEALSSCSMIIKKIDKKKDRVIVLNHKYNLLEQLDKCDDPALVLHLSTLIMFISATQNILHAAGRHVFSILTFLKQYLTTEQMQELTAYYDLVTLTSGSEGEAENAKERLKEKMPNIKLIAHNFKKIGVERS